MSYIVNLSGFPAAPSVPENPDKNSLWIFRADKKVILEIKVILILVHTINNPFLTLFLDLGGTSKYAPQTTKPEPSENTGFQDFDLVARV